MTVTTQDAFLPEKWSSDIIRATEANLVLANLVHDYSAAVKDSGDKVNIPELSNLTANDKVAGADVSFQAATESSKSITLNSHKEVSFTVEDIAAIQANVDLNAEYTQKAGYGVAKAVDSSLAALASGFSQTKGTYNTAITTDVILDSIELLDDADAPQDDRHFVMKPATKRDILDISTYVSNDFVSGKPVENGRLGSLYGVNTYMSTNIVKSGSNTNNMLFHRDALGIAYSKMPTTNSDYAVEKIGWDVVTDVVYGVAEIRDDHGVLVKT
jgi:hypothetical protein